MAQFHNVACGTILEQTKAVGKNPLLLCSSKKKRLRHNLNLKRNEKENENGWFFKAS